MCLTKTRPNFFRKNGLWLFPPQLETWTPRDWSDGNGSRIPFRSHRSLPRNFTAQQSRMSILLFRCFHSANDQGGRPTSTYDMLSGLRHIPIWPNPSPSLLSSLVPAQIIRIVFPRKTAAVDDGERSGILARMWRVIVRCGSTGRIKESERIGERNQSTSTTNRFTQVKQKFLGEMETRIV